jgi:hypothetical protein
MQSHFDTSKMEHTTKENENEVPSLSESEIAVISTSTVSKAPETNLSLLMQSVALPSRVMASAFRTPFKIAMKGRRLPSWSTQMEIVVTSFRSACRNAPRDISLMRAWTDIALPDLILPKDAIVHSSKLH